MLQVENETTLFYNKKKFPGRVLYQTPNISAYDLAIIECKNILTERLKAILISGRECIVGK